MDDTTNNLYYKQNETEFLLLLATQRGLFRKAKTIQYTGVLFSVLGAVFFSYLSETLKTTDTIKALSVLFSVFALLLNILLGLASNKKRVFGAKILHHFDLTLYGMHIDTERFSKREIDNLVADYINADLGKLRNWYSNYSSFTVNEQIFFCQQENVRWDYKLRFNYLWLNVAVGVLIITGIVIDAILSNSTIIQALAIVTWVFPFVQFFSGQIKELYENCQFLNDDLRKESSLISDIIHICTSDEILRRLIDYQLLIFEYRKKAVLIPDWFYRLCRTRFQVHEDAVAQASK